MTMQPQKNAITVWLTGLSGSGKSTLANAIASHPELAGAPLSVLDGDIIRLGLCKGLGFSEQDRHENVRRVAEAAKLLNEAGVTVICALISPLSSDRELARDVIGVQRFLEAFVAAPLQTCESRDPKGLYKRARAGAIPMFTGVSSSYEVPKAPAVVLSTDLQSVAESTAQLAACIRAWRGL